MSPHLILIGWGLWVSPCGLDACDALPVTDVIYTQQECEVRKKYLEKQRPNLYFLCGEVYRDSQQTEKNISKFPQSWQEHLPSFPPPHREGRY
ncbi:hypothetical protein [Moellerella wisconsensis]|uniref:Uncharacterized protein n=2 Tax=Moellerella wisconsensis TaxID=158849 RepID=A0ACD3Y3Z4_9GAMM|nr:hypothetical protein [Moellerella wisconsensis]UNH23152.1 hypothetical protein MNY68_09850 [Moellerella wisconsensis]UNH26228.1 hypothetical protein MNY64_10065 [Moellerella wisconsensis]UNH29646.1 hypothetical protein MNY72_09650 [Moellerella wisconsensis]UNH37842.1 hypothetical protein MNY70_09955 [Moellerella wisconsensis]UNH41337.1 hypothetical protein MNY66_09675 [Moellerella wisconsensis]